MLTKIFMRLMAGIIVLIAVLELAGVFMPETDIKADPALVSKFVNDIQPLRSADVIPLIKPANSKPTFFYIYASWCPYCRKLMPKVVEIIIDGTLKDFNVVMLSSDNDFFRLGNYLVAGNYAGKFTPYLLKRSNVQPLDKLLGQMGSSFDGRIPYAAVFDANGKLVSETLGTEHWTDITQAIQSHSALTH